MEVLRAGWQLLTSYGSSPENAEYWLYATAKTGSSSDYLSSGRMSLGIAVTETLYPPCLVCLSLVIAL